MAGAPNDISDTVEIKDETAYKAAMRTLSSQDRPPAILRFLMSAFESYRQARKIGWSRPWNKYGINTFLSFKLGFPKDGDLVDRARAVLTAECADMSEDAKTFVDELFADDALMGFVFLQEFAEDGQRFESITLSFGRKTQRRYRDRVDLILEAPVKGSTAEDFSRLRVYVDPYAGQKEPLWQALIDDVSGAAASELFAHLCALSTPWGNDPARIWDHWTSRYIDYFGPRQWSLDASHFTLADTARPEPARAG